MTLSRQNIIWGTAVFAAFSLGGFFALPKTEAEPAVKTVSLSEPVIERLETSQATSEADTLKTKLSTSTPAAPPTICNQDCQADVGKFRLWSENIGRASEGGLDQAESYADYIRERPALREQLIALAENQSDGDFSRLLVATFRYLDPQDKLSLSQALMTSPEWAIRRKATSLFTGQDVLETQDEAQLAALMSQESDPRVAMPILQALGQSSVVKDRPELMALIDERMASAQDPDIRGEALIAHTQLTLNSLTAMPPQVLQSLDSQDYAYTAYGVQAMDLILTKLEKADSPEKTQAFQEAKSALETLISADYSVPPDHILFKADDLYFRYF